MAVGFKVITLKPQKVGKIGKVDAGVDVTAELGKFQFLQSLVDMGDVMLVPDTDSFVAPEPASPKVEEPEVVASESEDASVTSESVVETSPTPTADEPVPAGVEDLPPADDSLGVDYMDDPTRFTVSEVIAYAETHPEHVNMLLELEMEGKKRSGVIKALTALADS